MPHTVDPRHLVSTLTGTWRIGASNIPVWLGGQRRAPTVSYEPVEGHPLRLTHSVSYTLSDGRRERRSSVGRLAQGQLCEPRQATAEGVPQQVVGVRRQRG